jgi:hypothetical protein
MRTLFAITAFTAMAISACTSSADAPVADTSAAASTAGVTPSAAATGPAGDPTSVSSDEVEATGVVGAVDEAAGVIEIRATGGTPFTRIEVTPGARITVAGGGSLSLGDIRPSDRIFATGIASDTASTLVADRIEVSRVVPGAAPGG